MPINSLSATLEALTGLAPLLTPDLYTVQVADGPGGWGILLYGPEGQAMDRLAHRLGLAEQPDRHRQDERQSTRYRGGRAGRVEVTLATATHTVQRVTGRGYPAAARRAES